MRNKHAPINQLESIKLKTMNRLRIRLIISFGFAFCLMGCQENNKHEIILTFGNAYTEAWNSKVPDNMASFYAEDGTLVVNNGTAAIGRSQLAETAKSYMKAFPDMKLTMDSLIEDSDTYRYHWTFEGTNTGPDGTGNKIRFSGIERWTLNEEGLVQKSIGTYDAEDYLNQLNRIE